MTGYMRPVPFTGMSTWRAHTNRGNPPGSAASTEPGVDYYCRIGTPVVAAGAGVVVDTGDNIQFAGGRFITIDLDDGRRCRYLHLSRRLVNVGTRVGRGQLIAYSGATGYGTEDWSADPDTGGAHVHFTLWSVQRYSYGRYATLDPEPFMDETPRAAGSAGTGSDTKEKDIMAGLAVGTVVNVIPEYSPKYSAADGTLWIACADGTFKPYPPEYDENIRGILTVVAGTGTGDQDKLPILSKDDASALFRVWRIAVTGK